MMQPNFDNKIALVTGAGKGIGAAIAWLLANNGATVALLDCDEHSVTQIAERINKNGNRALPYVVDIANMQAVVETLNRVELELGPIELLAHVAGVLRMSAMLDMSMQDWNDLLNVNATGTFIVLTEVGRRMARHQVGSMVVVASNAATTPRMQMGGYAASKAAAVMVAKSVGLELAEKGIRCNVVSPGSTATEMLYQSLPQGGDVSGVIAGDLTRHRLGIPLGRIASTDNIAETVAFLLSNAAQHITLQDLRVDGGATLGN